MLNKKYLFAASCACALVACTSGGEKLGGGVSEETNTFAGVLLDVSGQPVSGATVLARHVSVDSIALKDTTDADGKFGFALKRGGNYALSSVSDSLAVYKTISFDGSRISMDLTLSKAVNYKGRVDLNSGIKAGNLTVSLPGSNWSASVDSEGGFEFKGIPEGTQGLQVSSPDQNHPSSAFALYLSDSTHLLVGPLPTSMMYNLEEVDLSVAEGLARSAETQSIQLPFNQDYGLISWWSMDYFREVDKTKLTTQDSRNHTDTVLVYCSDCFVPGKSGKALHLQSANQFGVIENDKGVLDSLTEMTFEAVVKIDSIPAKGSYRKNMVGKLGFGTDGDNDVFSFAVINDDCGVDVPSVAFFLTDGSGDSLRCENAVVSSDGLELGSWANYVVTWDGDYLSLFKNGVLNAAKPVSVKLLKPSEEPIFFGKEDIDFMLDDVRLGAKAINSADVLYRYYLRGGSL
ncbi:MAG: hypothetical protein MJY85_10330 [Fibrobacter sp.]|nr:hypothetical protein [Fibrobacter sp.]